MDLLDNAIDEQVKRSRSQDLRSSMAAGMDANPDDAAKAITYSEKLGVPVDTAERNLSTIERQKKIDTFDADGIANDSPKTAQFLAEPAVARAAHDDVDSLRDLELKLSTRPVDYGRALLSGGAAAVQIPLQGLEGGLRNLSEGMAWMAASQGDDSLTTEFKVGLTDLASQFFGTAGEGWKFLADEVAPDENRQNFGTMAAQGLGQVAGQVGVAIASGGVTSVPSLVTGLLSGAGQLYGTTKGTAEEGTLQEAGSALGYGTITALTEALGMQAIIKGIPKPIVSAIGSKLLAAAEKVGLNSESLVASIVNRTANIAYGAAGEAAQEGSEQVGQNIIDKYGRGQDKEIMDGVGVNAGVGGVTGGIVSAVVSALTHVRIRTASNTIKAEAEVNSQNLKDLIDASKAPKTAERMPDKFKELVGRMAGDDVIYFGPDAAALYQSMPDEERAAVYGSVPGLEESVAAALSTGADIKMRKADFLSYVAPLASASQFADHVKPYPSLYSKAELLDEKRVKELEAQISRDSFLENPTDMQETRQTIASELTAQISKTKPYDQAEAGKVATLAADFYTNVFGSNALSVFRDGLRIANESRAIRAIPKTGDTSFPQKARAQEKANRKPVGVIETLLGTQTKKKREKRGPTPIMDAIQARGGIERGSPIAAELARMDITPKSHPRLFPKKGGMSDIDGIGISDLQQDIEGIGTAVGAPTNSADVDPYYVDRQWLIDQISAESFGNGMMSQEQRDAEAQQENIAQVLSIFEQRGVDILSANDSEVNDVLKQISDEYEANQFVDELPVFNENTDWGFDDPIFQADPNLDDTIPKDIEELQGRLVEERYGGVETSIYEQPNGDILLGKIDVDDDMQGQGYGTKAMNEIARYADANGLRVLLSPSTDFGASSVGRLKKFYKRFGFVENKGRNKDFTTKESMIREPRQRLAQGTRGKYRGYISPIAYGRYMIALGQRADKSTLLHEFSHLFLYQMRDGFEQGLIRPERMKVYSDAMAWFGDHKADVVAEANRVAKEQNRPFTVTEEDVQRAIESNMRGEDPAEAYAAIGMQELFARNFEQYLLEGKAPSLALRRAFQSFKAWLTKIYSTVRHLNHNLDDDLRGIFDRMLASDQDIEAARQKTEFKPMTREQFGGTDEEFADYERQYQDAIDFAKDDVLRQYLDKLNDEKSPARAAQLEAIKTEVAKELDATPVYAAINGLSEGVTLEEGQKPVKLSKKLLQKSYAWDVVAALARDKLKSKGFVYTNGENAIAPDDAADLFGFESGDAMIRAMISAPPYEEALNAEATKRMEERHGKPTLDEEAKAEAIRNDKHVIMLTAELKAIGLRAGREFIAQRHAEAKAAASRIIGRRVVSDAVSTDSYLAAERRAANAAYAALETGDYERAFDEKRKQIANYYLYKASTEAAEYQEKAFRKLKYTKKRNKDLKSIDGDYADLVRIMMQKIGLRPGSFDAAKAQRQFDLLDPVDRQYMGVAQDFIKAELPNNYRDMRFEDFQASMDAMANVTKLGRERRTTTLEGEKVELRAWRGQVSDTFKQLLGDKTAMNKLGKSLSGYGLAKYHALQGQAWLRRMEYWVNTIEGNAINGPLHKVFRTVKDAAVRFRAEKLEYDKDFVKILHPVEDSFRGAKIAAPELDQQFDNRGQVIGMLYHIGNESNLTKLLDGQRDRETKEPRWTPEALQNFIQRMIKEGVLEERHFDYVQEVWDRFERLKDAAQRTHKEMYGHRFGEVTAQPFTIEFADGTTKTYRGGYYPAIADAMKSEDANMRQQQAEQDQSPFMFPSAPGFTKARVETYAEPLDMRADQVLRHLHEVLRFIHLKPAIRTARRLFNDKALQETIAGVDPHVVTGTIFPWLKTAEDQSLETNAGWKIPNTIFRFMRRKSAAMSMFGNIVNTGQQLFQIAPTIYQTGLGTVGTYLGSPVRNHNWIRQVSPFMRESSMAFEKTGRTEAEEILRGQVFSEENGLLKNGMVAVGKVSSWGDRHTYFLQQAVQIQLDNITWMAAYNQAVSEKGVDGKPMTDEDAIVYADKTVRLTQIKSSPEDAARFERQQPFIKMFTLFTGWYNGLYNLNNSVVQRVVAERGPVAAAHLGYAVFMNAIVPLLFGQMVFDALKGNFPDGDDDKDGSAWDDWLAYFGWSTARNVAAAAPGFGNAVNYLIDKKTGRFDASIRLSPVVSQTESVLGSLFTVPKAIMGKGDESAAWRDGLNMFYTVTGVPLTGQVTKSVVYLADVKEKDVKPKTKGDFISGLLVGSPVKK